MARTNIIHHPVCAPVPAPPWSGLAFLAVVYVVWGSTYLGIRVAVRGDGFPPFMLGAARLAIAGFVMMAWAALVGHRVRLTSVELKHHAISGVLLWVGGNGLVCWAVTRVDSGYAALVLASMPIFAVVIESVLDRRLPGSGAMRALCLGALGIVLLSVPGISSGAANWSGLLALLLAAMSWASGSIYQQRVQVTVDPLTSAAYQLVFGAIGFAIVALLRGEQVGAVSADAWWALAYLAIVGSVIGFGAYVYALRLLAASTLMTHAYVNPVVAVMLGWAFAGEALTAWTWAGTALVLLGVAEVFRHRST